MATVCTYLPEQRARQLLEGWHQDAECNSDTHGWRRCELFVRGRARMTAMDGRFGLVVLAPQDEFALVLYEPGSAWELVQGFLTFPSAFEALARRVREGAE